VKEKQSTVSRVIQCFLFREKRGRGSTHFLRVKEHARWLVVLQRWCAATGDSQSQAAS
jgi:hypothetical protein